MSDSGESPLTFPAELPVKVFGRNEEAFRTAVLAIVRAHYGDDHRVAERPSRRGSYLSLTVTVVAESREQIDAMYRELVASELVLMVL
jgi:uncharacterized protein